jgi:CRP-like cAMP-binding protein
MVQTHTFSPRFTRLLNSSRVKHFPRGQIILYEDDKPDVVYVLKTGAIKMYDLDDQGNEKILHIVGPPGLVPLAFFSGEVQPLHWFYSALIDCEVYVVQWADLQAQLLSDGVLAAELMNWFSREVHELLVRLSSLGKTNARDKIVAALKFLAVRHCIARRSGWLRVSFPVNHQLIADMTGITRESATSALKDLREDSIIRNARLTILEINPDKLFADDV